MRHQLTPFMSVGGRVAIEWEAAGARDIWSLQRLARAAWASAPSTRWSINVAEVSMSPIFGVATIRYFPVPWPPIRG